MALVLGSYKKVQTSGSILAGLAQPSLVYGFRWVPTPTGLFCAVRRISISMATTTPFAAGVATINAYAVRPYTTLDTTNGTAGVFTGNNAKLKSSFPGTAGVTTVINTTAAISGGTGAAQQDSNAFATLAVPALPAAATQLFVPSTDVFRVIQPDESPFILLSGEGFLLTANVPITGVWQLTVDVAWDEIVSY